MDAGVITLYLQPGSTSYPFAYLAGAAQCQYSSSSNTAALASSSVYSSSAQSSSVFSSSPAPSSAPLPPSPTSAAAYSDPRFVGLWGQSFYVGGVAGGVYCLLSDAMVQVNAAFVYLTNITCPGSSSSQVREHCFQEAGTYFGQLAVQVALGHYVTVTGGAHDAGFASVTVDGRVQLEVGEAYNVSQVSSSDIEADPTSTTDEGFSTSRSALQLRRLLRLLKGDRSRQRVDPPAAPPSGNSAISPRSVSTSSSRAVLSVHRTSSHQLRVQAGVYSLTIDNVDGYVDITRLDVTCWDCVMQQLQPDGLLGQTWNATAAMRGQSESEAAEYREWEDELLGCHHAHDRFCAGRSSNE